MGKPLRDTALFRTITGKNKTGRIIHGILDYAPIPNFHEILKASVKENPDQTFFQAFKDSVVRVDWTRTLWGFGFAIAYIKGWLTLEQLEAVKELIGF